MTEKIRALVGCQNGDCAEEVSYHLDMVRMWRGAPVCEECYTAERDSTGPVSRAGMPQWGDLPKLTLADLCE